MIVFRKAPLPAISLGHGLGQRPVYLDDDVNVYGAGDQQHYASSSHLHQQEPAPRPPPPAPHHYPKPMDYTQEDYGDAGSNALDSQLQTSVGNAKYRGNQCTRGCQHRLFFFFFICHVHCANFL